jgi:hypothetical protein
VRLRSLRQKIEFGDSLLFLYGLVFFREYTWIVQNEFLAWLLAFAGTLVAWSVYLYFKPEPHGRTPWNFWIGVALPLIVIYALRAPVPDLSFDVLNHRLIQGERALRGPQFLPGDFFPTIFPFNPASDMLTGLFRHLLGYRLGTIVNLLALIWTGTILEKILRPWLKRVWVCCLGVLLVLFTEHVMFEISNYMVDLLALPLILEAMRLALSYDESETKRWDLWWAALLLGGSVGLKLTNAAMVAPVMVVFAVRFFRARPDKAALARLAPALILFLLPLLAHVIYIYRQTGSPFFPFYNSVFKSPFWSAVQFYDGRWGPRNWRETLLWPLLSFWAPQRLSELGVYAGRLAIGFVVALPCLFLPRISARVRLLALSVLLGSFMWSATSGYARYGLFIELLSGILTLYLAGYIYDRSHALAHPARLGLMALPVALLISQCALSAVYVRRTEWSRRAVAFDDPAAFTEESRWLLLDRNLMRFQSPENRQLFAQIDGWIVSSVKSNGVQALLRPDLPMLAVNNREYFDLPEARRLFAQQLESLRGRRVYSLSLTDELDASLDYLKQRNLSVGRMQNTQVPFFSMRTQLRMTMIEIVLPARHEVARKQSGMPDNTEATAPLNDDAFLAQIAAAGVPPIMKPNEKAIISVRVKNLSEYLWPSQSRQYSSYLINAADTWFQPDGKTLVNNMDGRSSLPRDLWPGEEAELRLTVTAPGQPGDYVLEIDLVQEGVAFFKDKGSRTWHAPVKVQ